MRLAMNFYFYFYFITSLIASLLLFLTYAKIATKLSIIDKTNNFNNPETVTSGGLVIFLNLIIGFFFFIWSNQLSLEHIPNNLFFTFVALSILFIISFIDDLYPIDPKIKLATQIILIFFSLTSLNITSISLPLKVSTFLFVIVWVYITNIINFIDGVDGFAGTQVLFIFFNVILICYLINFEIFSFYLSLILLPVMIIFLYFNKPNAKIYLGDAGSIVLGFLVGFIFLELIILKEYLLAISLIIYPLTDCSITLLKRVYNKNLPWVKKEDYFFSHLQAEDRKNKKYIFKINFIFCFLNSFLIALQILINEYFFILNIFLVTIAIISYRKKIELKYL